MREPGKAPALNKLLRPFLRVFFHLLYHQFAWTYPFVSWAVSLGLWNRWILAVVPYLDQEPVLELGFGLGILQEMAHQKGIQIFGVDESWNMARYAIQKMKKAGSNQRLARGKAENLPFDNDYFRRVAATFPSDYIQSPATISEIWRVLTPGGKLVVLPFAWITGQKGLQRVAAWLFRITDEAPEKPQILSQWLSQYEKVLNGRGFQTSYQIIEAENSEILILIASKPLV